MKRILRDTPATRRLLAVVRVLVPIVLLAAAWRIVDGPAALDRLARAEPGWLAAAFLAAHVQIVLSALRWRLTAARLGVAIPARRAIADYYLAQLLNQTLPGGVVGDVARAVRTRAGADLVRAGQAVVIERMAGQIALGLVTATGLVVAVAVPGGIVLPAVGGDDLAQGVAAAIAVAAALALGLLAVRRLRRAVASFLDATRRALLAPGVWQRQLALGLSIVAANLATFAFAARATGTDLPLEGVLVLVPLVLTAMLLPLSVGGWGFREGAAAALFPLVGAAASAGLAASIAFGLVVLAAALPGLAVLLLPGPAAPAPDAPRGP